MATLVVPLGERTYPIVVAPGALDSPHLETLPREVAVISNTTVSPLYGDRVARRLVAQGARVLRLNLPDGESTKSLEWLGKAYDALAEFGLTRQGAVVAVGGGVVGDLAGFVAATWMRGVQLVQVPTSLLAMVDSSVGGKTGINHPRAKNLIGAFHQPSMVLIDLHCLATLPPRELHAGLAEVIKYGVIADAGFFEWLEENLESVLALDRGALEHVILRSCDIKARVVGSDERESDAVGMRASLNYGHTVGHAVEAIAGYGEFLHGEAVAIGMTVALRLAILLGTLPRDEGEELLQRQTDLLERAGLPVAMPALDWDALSAAMLLDKKTRAAELTFVLPEELGRVRRVSKVPLDQVRRALQSDE